MSAHAPHSVPTFALRIKAVGVGCPASTPAGVRAPLALEVPFKATYYDLADGFNTPWVADVDLDAWFAAAYGDEEPSTPTTVPTPTTPVAATPASTSPFARTPSTPGSPPLASTLPPPPHYPGYRVPPVGQLQILVKTPTAAIKAFVVPYDLRALPVGGRLLIRERTYVGCVASNSSSSAAPNSPTPASPTISPRVPDSPRETLRYAVQLQFACTPPPPEEDGEQAYYLARTIKLVFAQRPPERTDTVRDERADEVVPTAPADRGGEDWARVRAKYVARKSVRSSPTTSASPAPTSPTTPTTSSSSSSALKRRRPVRGFSPSCERPSTPVAVTSPRSLLSAFDPRGDDDDERAASPAAPAPAPASSLSTALASALLAPSPKPPGGTGGAAAAAAAAPDDSLARNVSPRPLSVADNLRRRDSRAERELSERLRAMELRLEEK
jgi:hypothetical protein